MQFEKYAKILQLGDPLLAEIFIGKWLVEEKSDGSCFRFGIDKDGNRFFGSKEVNYSDERPPDKMFSLAVKNANTILDKFDNTSQKGSDIEIFSEFFVSPKHNTLQYERVPKDNLMFLDATVDGQLLDPEAKAKLCRFLEMEQAPVLFEGCDTVPSEDWLKTLLETPSVLGKEKVEGIVIKNYTKRFITNNKSYPCFAKFVREEFKELNRIQWKQGIPLSEQVLLNFPKEARWLKAIQHCQDRGELEGSMRDMRVLIPELDKDFEEECSEAIKEQLYNHFRHEIMSGMRKGFAEFVKERLVKKALGEKE